MIPPSLYYFCCDYRHLARCTTLSEKMMCRAIFRIRRDNVVRNSGFKKRFVCNGASVFDGNRLKYTVKITTLNSQQDTQMSTLNSNEVDVKTHVIVDAVFKKRYLKCPHKKVKGDCQDCSPHRFCQHQRMKSTCKECKGAGICEHNRRKSRCKECKGKSICEHDRIKSRCKECKGTSICEHDRIKSTCKECKGTSICEHDRIKSTCKECKGASICEHNRRRSTCKECQECHICMDSKVVLSNSNTSGYKWQEVVGGQEPTTDTEIYNVKLAAALEVKLDFNIQELKSFEDHFFYNSYIKVKNTYYTPAGTCRKCHCLQQTANNNGFAAHLSRLLKTRGVVTKPLPETGARKTKEMKVKKALDEHAFKYVHDKMVLDRDNNCENSSNRPDFQVQHTHQELVNIYVEVDENQHKTYTNTCELVRLNNIAISNQFRRPLVVVRYNPDTFTVGNKRITCKELSRNDKEDIFLHELKKVMLEAAHPEAFPSFLRVIKIGFDCNCMSPTECGFVHTTNYPDQESLRIAYTLMQ